MSHGLVRSSQDAVSLLETDLASRWPLRERGKRGERLNEAHHAVVKEAAPGFVTTLAVGRLISVTEQLVERVEKLEAELEVAKKK